MGHCSSKISSLNDPKVISQLIDHDLYLQNLEDKLSYKLLILGIEEAGKSTLIKQLVNFGDLSTCTQVIPIDISPKKKKRVLSISRLDFDDVVTWNLINPENQGHNIKKWIDKFDNIQGIIYLIDLTDYLNPENLKYLKQVFKDKTFIEKPIFLIFSKINIFNIVESQYSCDNCFD